MILVGILWRKICDNIKKSVGLVLAVITLCGLLLTAWESNATDREVKAAVAQVKMQMSADQQRILERLLRSMEALEARVNSGDTLLRIQILTIEIDRLQERSSQSQSHDKPYWDERIRVKQRELDTLMDSLTESHTGFMP